MKKTIHGIETGRMIAALLVIANHTALFLSVSPSLHFFVTEVLARLAVPFFFMTSGYFLIRHYAGNERKLFDFVKKTAVLYMICIVMYLPLNIYNGTFSTWSSLPVFFRDLLFTGTFHHLWYLPASIIGACIAWSAVRKLNFKKAFIFTFLLFLIGLCGDSLYGIASSVPWIDSVLDVVFTLSQQTRNGIFFAPLYFVIGGYLHEHPLSMKKQNTLICFLFSLGCMTSEAVYLHICGSVRYSAMYLFQIPASFFLFQLLTQLTGHSKGYERDCSLIMYIIHPWMIVIIRMIAEFTHTEALVYADDILFIPVVIMSLICGYVYHILHLRYGKPDHNTDRNTVITDTDALLHNLNELKKIMQEGSEVMAVIKANAYGHDAFTVSTCLEKNGIRFFAVSNIDEAIQLRHYGITSDILILGYTDPLRAEELNRYRLTQTLISEEYAVALNITRLNIRAHIAVDTGMHRIGTDALDSKAIRRILRLHHLNITGIFTHLCVSDSTNPEDIAFTEKQIALFDACLKEIPAAYHLKTHVQASAGLLNYPHLKYDYVRLGISLYGVSSALEKTKVQPDLKPVLKIRTEVILIREVRKEERVGYGRSYICQRDSRIAVLPIGYGDGIPRNLSNHNSVVSIHGMPVNITGRICMDQMMVDVTDIPNIRTGEEVLIFSSELPADQAAVRADTISNELLSRLHVRN